MSENKNPVNRFQRIQYAFFDKEKKKISFRFSFLIPNKSLWIVCEPEKSL